MWFSSSAGVSTSDSSMKSTSSACSTSASAKCPIRTLAITGMVTVCMISRMTLMAAMRATPPSLRMSEGTRSRAITAQAPAFSAMRACSALVTSMMTPPLSISARPTLTRHSLEPLGAPLPLPFAFLTAIVLLLSYSDARHEPLNSVFFASLLLTENYEPGAAASEQLSFGVADFAPLENIASPKSAFERFDCDFLIHANRTHEIDVHLRCDGPHVAETADLAHCFVEQHGDNSAVQVSAPALIARPEHKLANHTPVRIVLI